MPSDWLVDGPAEAPATLVLAHGAGAAMDTPFMATIAGGLAEAGCRVVRFEFEYMDRSRRAGRRLPPSGGATLCQEWRDVVAAVRTRWGEPLVIGGKSLGGRIASMIVDEVAADGLIVLGYPFHPPGKPEKPRVEHLANLATPTLILQGERDPFGTPDEVAGYVLGDNVRVEWVPDGDHGFKPRKRSGQTEADNWQRAVEQARAFLAESAPGSS